MLPAFRVTLPCLGLHWLAKAPSGWQRPVCRLYNKYKSPHTSTKPIHISNAAVEVHSSGLGVSLQVDLEAQESLVL